MNLQLAVFVYNELDLVVFVMDLQLVVFINDFVLFVMDLQLVVFINDLVVFVMNLQLAVFQMTWLRL